MDNWIRYKQRNLPNRNDALNPEVVFQNVARETAVIRSLRKSGIEITSARILDVGCGSGGSLISLLNLGVPINNLTGIELLAERVEEGKNRIPSLELLVGDATNMQFDDSTFDMVLESTMFWGIPDDEVAMKVAREMIRVAKPGGIILLCDWRVRDPRQTDGALTIRRVRKLFAGVRIENIELGPLIPPIGRRLSRWLPSFYFVLQRLIPLLVGMKIYTLRLPAQPQ